MKKGVRIKFLSISFLCLLFSFFASAQTQEWASRFNGTSSQSDEASVLYVDANSNSYVAGFAYDSTGGSLESIAVVKYDANGNKLWTAVQRGSGYGYANAMAVDDSGNVFITGLSTNSLSDFVVLKYNSTGVLQWAKYFGLPGSPFDQGTAITTDANYVYITGEALANINYFYPDFKTIKLDIATGTIQSGWPQTYNGIGNRTDVPSSIAVDASGNVFVTGTSLNSDGDKDYVTIGYSASGVILSGWPQRWDGPTHSDDSPVQLLLSGTNIVVTGNCNQGTIDTTGDIGTIMYDYSGNMVSGWPQIYNGSGNSWDGVGNTGSATTYKPMAADGSGNIYVSGWSRNATDNYDMVTFKYNSAGVVQSGWPQVYDNGGNDDITRGLALDASNDVCITGWTAPANTFNNGNYITIEYDPSGTIMTGWPVFYNDAVTGDNQAMAIEAVGSDIWITGYSYGGNSTSYDFATVKYTNSNPTVGIINKAASIISVVVFPNPSSGKFTIQNTEANQYLTITDVLGQIVYKSQTNSTQTEVDLSRSAKGVYFYKITSTEGLTKSGKLIVD